VTVSVLDPPSPFEVAASSMLRAFSRPVEVDPIAHLGGAGAWWEPVSSATTAEQPAAEDFWAAPGVTPPGAGPRRAAEPDPATLALRDAMDAAVAVVPSELAPEQALARVKALQVMRQQLEMAHLRALSDLDTRRLFTLDDLPSTTAWVKAQDVPGVDSGDVTLAKRLRSVPKVAEELRAGRLATSAGKRLSAFLHQAGPHLDRADGLIDGLEGEAVLYGVAVDGVCQQIAEQIGAAADAEAELAELRETLEDIVGAGGTQRQRLEAALVVLARRCDPALLPSALALLLDALLPAQHDARAEMAEEARTVTLHRKSGGSGWLCTGELDDETGEMLATILDAAAATDPAAPDDTTAWREGRDAVGDDTLGPQDWPAEQRRPRSRAQQRHDALTRGLRALLDSGALGTRGKAAPHVGVTVDLDFVQGVPGSLPARTRHGARLSRQQIRELLCRSTFTRLVLDATSRVVEVGHTQRTSTALERLILGVQCGGVCQRAGCGNGPRNGYRLRPHHGELFSNTGRTALDDTVLICEPDHDHELHGKGRALRLKDGRVLGPNGWIRR
jgi:hypothetical protein